jgi:DNA-binding HxlR family transcriptional regulator
MTENVMTYEEFLKEVKNGIVTPSGNCPITPLLTMLQGKWKNQVLYELCVKEPIRFGELQRNLAGITNTMLTSTLRDLESDGLIERKQFNEIPPHVEYSFTEKGRDLMPVFYAMMNWGFKYEKDNEK